MKIKEKILDYISTEDYTPITAEELCMVFDIEPSFIKEFTKVLKDLEKDGLILKSNKGKYLLPASENSYRGVLEGNKAGYAYFIQENGIIDDVYISKEDLNGAWHQDIVLIRITKKAQDDKKAEGEVVRILEKNEKPIIGTYVHGKNFGFVIPDDTRYGFDIFISKGNRNQAKTNDKVVAKVKNRAPKGKNPEGVVKNIIGNINEKGVDITSIVMEFNLPYEFSNKVLSRARDIGEEVSQTEIGQRTDFRELFTVTIDGATAKDFDDAVSIDKKGDNYILYVHIADVTHYVQKGSAIDKEAYRRGNSIYLLDRVIPMLPKELSNGICSLNPGVDRLSVTVKMEINNKGKVIDYKFYESVINSDYRLIYTNVSDILEGRKDIYEDGYLNEKLKLMEELFNILKEKRHRRGSIDFNFTDPEIILGHDGKPIDIVQEERRVANRIIEEFMIVTNETVGSHFGFMEEPFIYRVHEDPSEMKVEELKKMIKKFGYFIKGQDVHPKDYQSIISEAENKPEEAVISMMLLRSMSKAEYSPYPQMHFGLASMFYSHFTSPIRRYPDLFIHRIVKNFLHHKSNTNNINEYMKYLEDISKHCSMTERRAEDAEHEVESMKMAQYMEENIGKRFDGVISGLTKFGIFVRLENGVEGLVSFVQMTDDYYNFNEESYIVAGQTRNKIYSLGQKVRVEVIDASSIKRQIDFKFIDGDINGNKNNS
ncbi:MAG: ribonuclease R [Lagierella massiliensis]|nr:ribonuclease R [Lagierella massiliensis]